MKSCLHCLVTTLVGVLALSGCADIEIPKTETLIKNPIGDIALTVGMTKDKVASVYGNPDGIRAVSSEEWGAEREEWFYKARYSALPVNAGYLAEDLYLYFDGENLTNISKVPLGEEAVGSLSGKIK